jgi:hypothetical protein
MNEQIIQNISHHAWEVAHAAKVCAQEIAGFHASWHAVLKPRLTKDGDMWCALYGENLQVGISGFGHNPAAALYAFEAAMCSESGTHSISKGAAP